MDYDELIIIFDEYRIGNVTRRELIFAIALWQMTERARIATEAEARLK